jgi:hypothetical protein
MKSYAVDHVTHTGVAKYIYMILSMTQSLIIKNIKKNKNEYSNNLKNRIYSRKKIEEKFFRSLD